MSDNASIEQMPLDTWGKGEELDHRKLNQPVRALQALRGVNGPNQERNPRPLLRRFKITAIADEYLTCNEIDGVTAATAPIYVAKPYQLRVSIFGWTRDSVTYARVNSQRRTATSGATSETQEITQKYVVGDEIYAARLLGGGVGQAYFTSVTPLLGGGDAKPVQWLDMNVDGRAWAKIA